MTTAGGYLVVGFEVEEFVSLGGAAGGSDGLGVDADDLAELADGHELAGVVDELDGGTFPIFLSEGVVFMLMTPDVADGGGVGGVPDQC